MAGGKRKEKKSTRAVRPRCVVCGARSDVGVHLFSCPTSFHINSNLHLVLRRRLHRSLGHHRPPL